MGLVSTIMTSFENEKLFFLIIDNMGLIPMALTSFEDRIVGSEEDENEPPLKGLERSRRRCV